MHVPGLGHLPLPPPEGLAYLGILGTMAVLEVIEWPVALVLGIGHVLATRGRRRVVREIGEGLEEGA